MDKSKSWKCLSDFFDYLNSNILYVVMRNFEGIPEYYNTEEHGDIDILTDNYMWFHKLSGVSKVYSERYRVHHEILIGDEKIRFDFRYVGDGYYDRKWEKDILKNRTMGKGGIYIPNNEDYGYMLLYHALIQKKQIARDYTIKLNHIFGEGGWNMDYLKDFMNRRGYRFVCPNDLTVIYNWDNVALVPPIKRNLQKAYYMTKAFVRNKCRNLSLGGVFGRYLRISRSGALTWMHLERHLCR